MSHSARSRRARRAAAARRLLALACAIAASYGTAAGAAPPVPSGAHPRLFMSAEQVAGYRRNAATTGTAARQLIDNCQHTLDAPGTFTKRGGPNGNVWPHAAVSCAFAYRVAGKPEYLSQAQKYLRAALEDDQVLGDRLGCVAGVSLEWESRKENAPAPAVILTVTHDTGYPMRWYGPFVALVYDWLSGVPGADPALLGQARTCLTEWIDYYTARGYHRDEPGTNYHAGFAVGKTLAAIAIGADGGADGHLWTETVDGVFRELVSKGLAGTADAVGTKAGAMAGGDWAEGWQYGPLSVLEYAAATRALADHGVAQPEMQAWIDSVIVRYIHGTVPGLDGQWVGGDTESDQIYLAPNVNLPDTALIGPSSENAAAWAAHVKQAQRLAGGGLVYHALAELRAVAAADYRAQSPPPPLWYVARGTRAVYARSDWSDAAFWTVFSSAPHVVPDHQHFSASSFVFTRGRDHLIVDPSNYGEPATFETNAVSADSGTTWEHYVRTQTPWSEAELLWVKGTRGRVVAARSDLTRAFLLPRQPNGIAFGRRDFTMLPEGEIVTVDRVETQGADRPMYVRFHANTGGTLALDVIGRVASGRVGGSRVAIHRVASSGGVPAVARPPVGPCKLACRYPCGPCEAARFQVDRYSLDVPGPKAMAIHVIDGLEGKESPPRVVSINDDGLDPEPRRNGGVIGAAVLRSSRQTFVVASSAARGEPGKTMSYRVPAAVAARHVVFDAPEDTTGQSRVQVNREGDRCAVTITAGKGFAGRPLVFNVASAAEGCTAVEDPAAPPANPVFGGGSAGVGSAAGAGGGGGCVVAAGGQWPRASWSLAFLLGVATRLCVISRARRVG